MIKLSKEFVGRKYLWLVAGLVIALGAVTASGQRESHSQIVVTNPIVGTWECSGSPPPFLVTKDFNAGGTMIEVDNISFQESPTIGRWKQTGPLSYFLVARQYTFDPSGNFVGTYQYTQPLTMDSSLDSLEGTFNSTLVDPNGNSIASGSGQVRSKRMPFDAQP